MDTRIQLFSIAAAAVLLFIVFELVRRRRLLERYALLWLGSTVVLLGLAVWKDLLVTVSTAVGIYYAPSALFAVTLAFVLMLLLHFSLVISRLADQNKVLAQKLGMLQERVAQLEGASGAGAGSDAEREPRVTRDLTVTR